MTQQAKGRYFLDKANPRIWRALNSFGVAVGQEAQEAGVPRALLELMYVRISQINGCVYCLDLHTKSALGAGVAPELLAMLPAWRDTTHFSEEEQAALTIGEVTTTLPEPDERQEKLTRARQVLGDEAFGLLEWAAIAMNTFNRVSILSQHPAPKPKG